MGSWVIGGGLTPLPTPSSSPSPWMTTWPEDVGGGYTPPQPPNQPPRRRRQSRILLPPPHPHQDPPGWGRTHQDGGTGTPPVTILGLLVTVLVPLGWLYWDPWGACTGPGVALLVALAWLYWSQSGCTGITGTAVVGGRE